nr:gdsl esterase/lipase [Quercus suber]
MQIVNWRTHLKFPEEAKLSPEAKDLISKLLCNVSQRLGSKGADEIKVLYGVSFSEIFDLIHELLASNRNYLSASFVFQAHPWFKGIDWEKIYHMEAAFIPEVNDELDTQNFEKFEESDNQCQSQPKTGPWRKMLSSKDINFVGYTYKNFEIVNDYQVPGMECNEIFGSSLFLMGEIGGNDYNYPFFLYRSIEEIQTFVPLVIKAIASAINELIELGAVTLMVPGNLPIGCSAAYLTYYETADTDQYDPETGCLNWLNKFSEYHNDQLQKELSRIQALHPHTNIIYADFYNSSMRFYRNPSQYGFTGGALTACCGGGGPYNFNTSAICGYPSVSACDDPSKYVSWDGIHLTEAAYRWITNGLLEGPYTIPQISISCVSQDA